MYSYNFTSLSTFSLLSSFLLVALVDAYPTHLYPSLRSRLADASTSPSISSNSQPISPSREGTLFVHLPTTQNIDYSHPPSSSPLSIPYTLTSTCPQILPTDRNSLTSDLLAKILLLYPEGPTSSPYYTFSAGDDGDDASKTQDTYSITQTAGLATGVKGVEYRSSLYISVMTRVGKGKGGYGGDVGGEEWRGLMGVLGGLNKGLGREMERETRGQGFGKLVVGGKFPVLRGREEGLDVDVDEEGEGDRVEKERKINKKLAPSDIILPSYPHELVRDWDGESAKGKEDKVGKKEEKKETEEVSFEWKATWVYYGVVTDENGGEVVRECGQMPLGLEVEGVFESRGEESENGRKEEEVEEEEGRWKIDL
ncbi:hypothetical protein SBOR_3879 [Sclerotinia borealis F-4128]|uniref:Uncharacterized protein n=1 Tax=Sclerotinia borealis (strain F-4128) TaxID=1432307 RepID=W9CMH1_SCLBF|nr:hypothetical protein SBOR_3879 [Sclerotinia borealis F-4128]